MNEERIEVCYLPLLAVVGRERVVVVVCVIECGVEAAKEGGPGGLVYPFQDEDLGVVDLRAGYGGGDADQLLVAEEGEAAVLFCK